jgi:signal transduction histidine kinase
MSLRARLLLAFALVVFVPLALLSIGFRHEVTKSLRTQYEHQLDIVESTVEDDLQRTGTTTQQQLNALSAALPGDNRLRAALAGVPEERQYLFEWAASAMHLTGMSLLQLLDEDGQILSSGHFRNEHGRVIAGLLEALRNADTADGGVVLMRAPGVEHDLLTLVRHAPVRIGDRTLHLVGGVLIDGNFLKRLAANRDVAITLRYAGSTLTSTTHETASGKSPDPAALSAATRPTQIPAVLVGDDGTIATEHAILSIVQSRDPLVSLLSSVDSWFLTTAVGAILVALLLALWLSSRVTRRLATLADKTAVIDLDRLDVEFDEGTDEVGRLSRVLGDLTARLHAGTARVREAERRATVGDLARQITHDIKNGLIPLQNVMRHLTQVSKDDPAALASVLTERRQTIDSSIRYLQTLATNYERLSTTPQRRECDVHALIDDVSRAVTAGNAIDVRVDLAASNARVIGDPIAIRRILENLITNAADSLGNGPGQITVSTATVENEEGRALTVTVADTGRGMSPEEASRIFEHFYSTKQGGSGLGLSIVRRLVTDLHGSVRVESDPGKGTRVIVEIPTSSSADARASSRAPSRRHAEGRS